jgi:hypothetical protein
MRLILSLTTFVCAIGVLGLLIFLPAPDARHASQAPLLDPLALGLDLEQGKPLDRAQLQQELASLLATAHPTGGLHLEGIFGAALNPDESSTPALGNFPAIYRPRALRASIQEGGIRLSWLPHPRNPVQDLQYRLERWNSDGKLEVNQIVESNEWLDRVDCEALTYHYRVYAELERALPGNTARSLRRTSPAATVMVALPRESIWLADEIRPNGALLLRLQRPKRPELGPFVAPPGQMIGNTGWLLESYTKGETEVPMQTSIPRFDAFGRRIIVDGRPAFRSREDFESRIFVTVHLMDPCGLPWRQDLVLPSTSTARN